MSTGSTKGKRGEGGRGERGGGGEEASDSKYLFSEAEFQEKSMDNTKNYNIVNTSFSRRRREQFLEVFFYYH